MELLNRCYELGNRYYVNSDYNNAIDQYSRAITFNSPANNHDVLHQEIYLKLLLNRSQCYLKLREYESAIKDCSDVIFLEKSSVFENCNHSLKALLRRAMAYEYLGDFKKSFIDTELILNMNLTPSSITKSTMEVHNRVKSLVRLDDCLCVNEGVPDRLVSNHQALRLNILESPPNQTIFCGESSLFKVCIANEFGLWNRSIYSDAIKGGVAPKLEFSTYILPHSSAQYYSIQILAVPEEIDVSGKFSINVVIDVKNKELIPTLDMLILKLGFSTNNNSIFPEIFAVLSLPLHIVSKSEEVLIDKSSYAVLKAEESHYSCIRKIELGDLVKVYAFESPGFLGIGGKV